MDSFDIHEPSFGSERYGHRDALIYVGPIEMRALADSHDAKAAEFLREGSVDGRRIHDMLECRAEQLRGWAELAEGSLGVEGLSEEISTSLHLPDCHPDEALLDLCLMLKLDAAEWQRLYDVTPEEAGTAPTPADEALERFSDEIWPGFARQGQSDRDQVGKLLTLPARTDAGRRARAAAVLAIEQAERYLTAQREDLMQMQLLVIREAAGADVIWLGYPDERHRYEMPT